MIPGLNKPKNMAGKPDIKKDLQECNTLNEMFAVLNKHYDLDTRLGSLQKPLAISQIGSRMEFIAKTLSIKKRY